MRRMLRSSLLAVTLSLAGFPFTAFGVDDVEELKRQVDTLQKQLEQVQDRLAGQETTKGSEAQSAVHLSGYAAVGYTDVENGNGAFNAVSFNPIFHYLYRDLFFLEAELEIAIDDVQEQWGGGVNYWFSPNAVAKAGYESNEGTTGSSSDDNRVLLQLANGF